MNPINKDYVTCLLFILSLLSGNLHAALVNGSTLSFVAASGGFSATMPASGSWFGVDPGTYGYYPIGSYQGIIIGTAQPASGSHFGVPDGSESPSIDVPHVWYGNTGMFGSASPITIISTSGNTATLDFTGIRWNWNGLDNIVINSSFDGDSFAATMTCAVDCGNGDSYVLDFSGHIPPGSPTGFSGETVVIHLEGTISSVPLPGAAWLFGSGVLALMGVVRRTGARSSGATRG